MTSNEGDLVAVIPVSELEPLVCSILTGRGLVKQHAWWVTKALIETSLRGIDTHGLNLLPVYVRELDAGIANAKPSMSFGRTRPTIVNIDADAALGIVAGLEAANNSIEISRAHGIGIASVRNSNHFGAASVYSLRIARAGMVGLAVSNSDALVVPFNGKRPMFGTNPISFAVPVANQRPFCADFATSQGSFIKSMRSYRDGQTVDRGVLVDADGNDVAETGATPAGLFPLGGYKGQCLGMIVEILCAILSGSPFDHQLSNLFEESNNPRMISHLFVAIDVEAFQPMKDWQSSLDWHLNRVRSTPARDAGEVLVPGDLEENTLRLRLRAGIPVEKGLMDFLRRNANGQDAGEKGDGTGKGPKGLTQL